MVPGGRGPLRARPWNTREVSKCDGQLAASGSRTLNVAFARPYQFWTDEKLRHRWLPDAEIEITTATSNKSLRAKWDGGKSRLSVNFYAKGLGKSQAAVDHLKLATSKRMRGDENLLVRSAESPAGNIEGPAAPTQESPQKC